ncbi:hypothetical protein KOAAANKH_00239 [Brevundimonas sp. NIBR10]|uniref:helix-turn-helix domain-containing protein n=1 Tax=Brevundimonas sp. NIBR10 TaxID=3015997 RepID=UPI0022F158CD|nr:transcriptional regulator [Brevundimonas sp. NIBR10]WGM45377.1 hypothetical protein KOAAANKH_00239 [Brevundimonas sp. NIBR10]
MSKTRRPAIDIGDEDHDRIMAGLAEAKAILDGVAPSDSYVLHRVAVPDRVDVKAIRSRTGLSQVAFAARYGFSPGAVRDWEQNRKPPEKANRLLLTIIERRPDVIDDLLTA